MSTSFLTFSVKGRRILTPTVFELSLELKMREGFSFKSGQFLSLVIPGVGFEGRDIRRAYSIASPPEKNQIDLCLKQIEDGPGSTYLFQRSIGEEIKGLGPYGMFTFQSAALARRVCFIATGTGVAPFRSMMFSKDYRENPPQTALCVLGVREETELLYTDEFGQIPGLQLINMVSRPRETQKKETTQLWKTGRVTDFLKSLGVEFPWFETDFYLCGNGAMVKEVKTILEEKGVAKTAIYHEVYYK